MDRPEPRRLSGRGENRREQILAAAADLFSELGFEGTRVSDIARRTGVAKSLFYWYFPSKTAVVGELSSGVQRRLRQLQGDAVATLDDPLRKLYVGTLVSVRHIAANQHLYRVVNALALGREPEAEGPRPFTASAVHRHALDTARILSEGQQSGVVRQNDSAMNLAYCIGALVDDLVRMQESRLMRGRPGDLAALAARAVVYLAAADTSLADDVVDEHTTLAGLADSAFRGPFGTPRRRRSVHAAGAGAPAARRAPGPEGRGRPGQWTRGRSDRSTSPS